MYTISFIGAGNVALRFSLALAEVGYEIDTIYNRSEKNMNKVVKALQRNGCSARPSFSISDTFHSDIVIIAISDNSISEVVESIAYRYREDSIDRFPIFLHTSGATSIDVFSPLQQLGAKCGVLYPLMTLNKNKNVEFKDVPLLLECSDCAIEDVLDEIATKLGSEHYFYTSEQRLRMHVAAVFTCNFVNYILNLGFSVIGRDHPLLLPSTLESVRNCFLHNPDVALTGPARRGDFVTIEKHLELLDNLGMEQQKEIYTLLTEMIMKKYHIERSSFE